MSQSTLSSIMKLLIPFQRCIYRKKLCLCQYFLYLRPTQKLCNFLCIFLSLSPFCQCVWSDSQTFFYVYFIDFYTGYVILPDQVTNQKHQISTTTMFIAITFGRVVTYNQRLPPILKYDPSIKWSCKITPQIEHVMSPLALDQWTPNTDSWELTVKGFQPRS